MEEKGIYSEVPKPRYNFWNKEEQVDTLLLQYQKHGSLIVAVDFDDTVFDSYNKGRDFTPVHNLISRAKAVGCKIMVFTARNEMEFRHVIEYYNDINIEFDKLNDDIIILPQGKSRKPYFNILLDDKAGLMQSFEILLEVINIIEKQIKDKEIQEQSMKSAINELLIDELVTKNSFESNLCKYLEESAELTVELMKTITKGQKWKPPIEKLQEECAHVEIRLAVLKKIIGEEQCNQEINKKQNEIAERFKRQDTKV